MNFEFLVKFREDGFEDVAIAAFLHMEDAESFIGIQQDPECYYAIDTSGGGA